MKKVIALMTVTVALLLALCSCQGAAETSGTSATPQTSVPEPRETGATPKYDPDEILWAWDRDDSYYFDGKGWQVDHSHYLWLLLEENSPDTVIAVGVTECSGIPNPKEELLSPTVPRFDGRSLNEIYSICIDVSESIRLGPYTKDKTPREYFDLQKKEYEAWSLYYEKANEIRYDSTEPYIEYFKEFGFEILIDASKKEYINYMQRSGIDFVFAGTIEQIKDFIEYIKDTEQSYHFEVAIHPDAGYNSFFVDSSYRLND